VDAIGLYQLHRPDPEVPFVESLGALKQLYEAGVVRHIGLSNVDVEQIRIARRELSHALVSVQNQFSPSFRESTPELRECIEQGLAFLPWSPLGGIGKAGRVGSRTKAFGETAKELGVSPQQVALAWELHLSHLVIPIPGASRPSSIKDSARAADLELDPETMAYLSASH
jgi:aryl-alcohol dehydrogenase-like predicted oxidoreductase